ncbi:hypothetical protein [Natrinema sp. 1APR25-10V2]|uniref:hypothetical protein n=1 Tax=Natrinema sp. 1APR25-10V2 TaxID=2951081 RepID=UPI0028747C69|nr:hypothetical protein [Natrinema sp. 1APR25-10V2]MDS0473987.1 hypothetical protein [Natrinema sp. 1APR25-10V2]
MLPAFVPGGMGPPDLLVLVVVLLSFLAVPIVIIVAIWKYVIRHSRDGQRMAALEQRIEELENEEQ